MTRFVSSVVVLAFLMAAGSACGAGDPGGGVSGSLAQAMETGDSGATAMVEPGLESASEPPSTSVPEFQSEEESESPSDISGSASVPETEPEQLNERQAIQLTNNDHYDGGAIWSPDGSRIAFLSDSDGDNNFDPSELMIMNADGTNVEQITDHLIGEGNPSIDISWSPDGSHILLIYRYVDSEFLDWDFEMFVVEVASLAIGQLADSDNFGGGASWSPDGKQILFQSGSLDEADENSEIFVIDIDGSNIQQLTDNDSYDGGASWSPDGKQILFQRGYPFGFELADEYSELFLMDADGSNMRQLTVNDYYDGEGVWSPDGSKIMFDYSPNEFEGDYGGGSTTIIEANKEAYGTVNSSYCLSGYSWSPDGSRILCSEAAGDGKMEYYLAVVDVDRYHEYALPKIGTPEWPLGWSPDSSKILIAANDGDIELSDDGDVDDYIEELFDDIELFVVELPSMIDSSSKVRQLTDNDSYDGGASWSPDGSRILFISDQDGDSEIFVMDYHEAGREDALLRRAGHRGRVVDGEVPRRG